MKKCIKCHYGKVLSGYAEIDENIYCDYLCMTGERRGCDAKKCTKYKPKAERENNFSKGDIAK